MIREILRDWIPRRTESSAHFAVWDSPNHKVFLSLGGDIYDWHLILGDFFAGWDRERSQ